MNRKKNGINYQIVTWEGGLYLHLLHHRGYSRHHLPPAEQPLAHCHQLRVGLAVPDELHHLQKQQCVQRVR
jgi:hypothetical protein